jgi:quinol monooxygenase YgiN
MSIRVILELQAPAGKADELLAYLEQVLPETRKYPGYEELRVTRDVADPAWVIVVEKWESAAAYQRYLGWRTQTGVMTRLASLLANSPAPLLLCEIAA